MSSVTSERPAPRARNQTTNPGMVRPSPDSRRRVLIDNIILSQSQSKQKKKKAIVLESSDDESVAGGNKKHKRPATTDSSPEPESPTVNKTKKSHKKTKGKSKAAPTKGDQVSNCFLPLFVMFHIKYLFSQRFYCYCFPSPIPSSSMF